LVATYNYVGSRLDNVVYGNGVKTQMSYDNASRPNGISTKTNNGNGSTIYAASFVMDNLGNHTEENETHPFATIPTPTAGSTTYNYTNNRLNSESTTNGTTSSGTSYTHDNDGNITNKGFGYNLNYDLEDNLTNYTNGSTTHSYEYDAFGNRRKAIRNGTETRYIKDINGLATDIAETNSSNAVQHYYIHGLGLVASVKPDGTTIQYYHADFRGSIIAMTNASQTITHKYQYDEFGNLTNSQEADPNPYRYVGAYGIMYEAPDLTYMRARYYDPTTGRFNSEDPIWSTNLYPYAGNNPIIFGDVNGKFPEPFTVLGGAIFGAITSSIKASKNGESGLILASSIAQGFLSGGADVIHPLFGGFLTAYFGDLNDDGFINGNLESYGKEMGISLISDVGKAEVITPYIPISEFVEGFAESALSEGIKEGINYVSKTMQKPNVKTKPSPQYNLSPMNSNTKRNVKNNEVCFPSPTNPFGQCTTINSGNITRIR
jgi:RHS repeat-associated protein